MTEVDDLTVFILARVNDEEAMGREALAAMFPAMTAEQIAGRHEWLREWVAMAMLTPDPLEALRESAFEWRAHPDYRSEWLPAFVRRVFDA